MVGARLSLSAAVFSAFLGVVGGPCSSPAESSGYVVQEVELEPDAFDVEVAPADGYGERHDEAVQNVPRDAFPPEAELQAGLQFQATGPDGQPLMGTITSIEGEVVTVDFNHPLAGETLHFSIEVVSIRDATEEEREHGHVH